MIEYVRRARKGMRLREEVIVYPKYPKFLNYNGQFV
jgi:hypothetical protein